MIPTEELTEGRQTQDKGDMPNNVEMRAMTREKSQKKITETKTSALVIQAYSMQNVQHKDATVLLSRS